MSQQHTITYVEVAPKPPAAPGAGTKGGDVGPFDSSMADAIKEGGSKNIDWDCPCLEAIMNSPCAEEFKEVFSGFVDSKTEPKGLDCLEGFRKLNDCMTKNKEYFGGMIYYISNYRAEILDGDDDDDDDRPAPGNSQSQPSKKQ